MCINISQLYRLQILKLTVICVVLHSLSLSHTLFDSKTVHKLLQNTQFEYLNTVSLLMASASCVIGASALAGHLGNSVLRVFSVPTDKQITRRQLQVEQSTKNLQKSKKKKKTKE